MLLIFRDIFYGAAILAGLGVVYTTLGTLNGRLPGGFTPDNRPWAICIVVLVIALVGCSATKAILLVRRRHQKPFRSHTSGRGWVQDE